MHKKLLNEWQKIHKHHCVRVEVFIRYVTGKLGKYSGIISLNNNRTIINNNKC